MLFIYLKKKKKKKKRVGVAFADHLYFIKKVLNRFHINSH